MNVTGAAVEPEHDISADEAVLGQSRFGYLLEKLERAEFSTHPFPHLHLSDFLSAADFEEVTQSSDVDLPVVPNIDELFVALEKAGYEPIAFPGCTQSRREYKRWIEKSLAPSQTHGACEAQGMALRLGHPRNDTVRLLDSFFRSPQLESMLRKKFGISAPTTVEAGVQKYLRGYEISPHPDIRQKALTWMLNINPAPDSGDLDIHTHYLKLKPEWTFVSTFWQHNPDTDTCWVPWDWCTTEKRQTDNNSIVLFSPRWDTIHGVRARYDHLRTQRTQFYGNLWYEKVDRPSAPQFQHFNLSMSSRERSALLVRKALQRARSKVL